jgi:hypothetical protein
MWWLISGQRVAMWANKCCCKPIAMGINRSPRTVDSIRLPGLSSSSAIAAPRQESKRKKSNHFQRKLCGIHLLSTSVIDQPKGNQTAIKPP